MTRTTAQPRSAWRMSPLLLLVVLLAACGTGEAGQTGEEATTPTAEETAAATGEATEPVQTEQTEAADQTAEEEALTVYSGRNEELVGPILERFTEDTGVEVEVRYGDTAELAATILEEGGNSPADVYFAQDAGALGALANEGMLASLEDEHLQRVEERFRSPDGEWVGVSGRARVLVYNTEALSEEDLPDSVLDLTEEQWRGRVGWAPTNGSFQSFVTAMRVQLGDEATLEWLEGMIANDVQVYENNSSQVEAAGTGEIDVGLVNHYYLPRIREENPDITAENHFLADGDIGSLINVAGVAVLDTSDQSEQAQQLVDYLLSDEAQSYFAEETYEYPLVTGVGADPDLPPLESIETPDIDLSDLDDLAGTLELLRQAGALN